MEGAVGRPIRGRIQSDGECAPRNVLLNAIPMSPARRELRPVRHSRAGGNPEGWLGGLAESHRVGRVPCRTTLCEQMPTGLDSRLRGSDVGRSVVSFRRSISPSGSWKVRLVGRYGAGSRVAGNARQGAFCLTRSRCRQLGENHAPFVIPAQAGIQRCGGEARQSPRPTPR